MVEKQKYRIAKDNFDGTEETVWTGVCTEKEALDKFNEIAIEQSNELCTLKPKSRWRQIRLYNQAGERITQES